MPPLQLAGLGNLRPNLVVMRWPERWRDTQKHKRSIPNGFVSITNDCYVRRAGAAPEPPIPPPTRIIDSSLSFWIVVECDLWPLCWNCIVGSPWNPRERPWLQAGGGLAAI